MTSFACSGCNRYAFSAPTVCFWCRGRGVAAEPVAPEPTRLSTIPRHIDITREFSTNRRKKPDSSGPTGPGLFGG